MPTLYFLYVKSYETIYADFITLLTSFKLSYVSLYMFSHLVSLTKSEAINAIVLHIKRNINALAYNPYIPL